MQCAISSLDLQLLYLLWEKKGECVNREDLKTACWPHDPQADEKLDAHIQTIRKVLQDFPDYRISTAKGRGILSDCCLLLRILHQIRIGVYFGLRNGDGQTRIIRLDGISIGSLQRSQVPASLTHHGQFITRIIVHCQALAHQFLSSSFRMRSRVKSAAAFTFMAVFVVRLVITSFRYSIPLVACSPPISDLPRCIQINL